MKPSGIVAASLSLGCLIGLSGSIFGEETPRPDVAQQVAPTTRPADAAALVAQLGDANYRTRNAAIKALTDMGLAAGPALREGIKSSDPEVRNHSAELLDAIDHPNVNGAPLPQASAQGVNRFSMNVGITSANNRKIRAEDNGRITEIEQTDGNIVMTVTGQLDGHQVTHKYTFKDAMQLKHENPDAYNHYMRYAGATGMFGGQAGIRFNVGGQVLVNNINVAPGAANVRPMTPAHRMEILERVITAKLGVSDAPESEKEKVTGLLKAVREAAPKEALAAGAPVPAEYQKQSDLLRKKLGELRIDEPLGFLPPSSHGRLGIFLSDDNSGKGVSVSNLTPNSRGEKLGLKLNDFIKKINDKDVHNQREFRQLLNCFDDNLILEVMRDGQPVTLHENNG